MRISLILVMFLTLAGCVSPADPQRDMHINQLPAKLYKDMAEVGTQSFEDIGDVSGSDCQMSNQDAPPNIAHARQDMLMRASRIKANAVVLDSCEITGNVPGCYRQAVCRGAAIHLPAQ